MDHLSADTLAELRAALEALRTELSHSLALSANAAKPVQLDQSAMGRVSRIDAIQQQKMVSANRRRQKLRLQQCTAALKAMGEGEYGLCRRCEEAIAIKRLRVRPETPVCLECQSAMEAR